MLLRCAMYSLQTVHPYMTLLASLFPFSEILEGFLLFFNADVLTDINLSNGSLFPEPNSGSIYLLTVFCYWLDGFQAEIGKVSFLFAKYSKIKPQKLQVQLNFTFLPDNSTTMAVHTALP
ncbi:hypothetical protein KIL84_012474 [Mauremys mutica]|uniref:Uncharacterized protein n=1 Tax=Mauremys mutica TaxID=74926 RepID=A0A9D3XR27_9SAUR|nr:hypothetical protein KIL84_012474 [Mauremys mutica]